MITSTQQQSAPLAEVAGPPAPTPVATSDSPIECGIYPDLEAEAYHNWFLASKTYLVELLRSPRHAYHAIHNPKEQTPALRLGSAVHCLTLEGDDAFLNRFVVATQCEAFKKDGSRCEHPGKALSAFDGWFCGQHAKGTPADLAGRTILAPDEFAQTRRMADAVWSHPFARKLLEARTAVEVSYVWDDADTGIRCKARMDLVCGGLKTLCDLKTTTDASADAFRGSIKTFGYDVQSAHYLNAPLTAQGEDFEEFAFICVEKEEPHCVAVYVIDPESVAIGHEKRRRALIKWGECADTGNWHGYPEKAQLVGLPEYDKDKFVREQTALLEASL